jgi:hypothetical protein
LRTGHGIPPAVQIGVAVGFHVRTESVQTSSGAACPTPRIAAQSAMRHRSALLDQGRHFHEVPASSRRSTVAKASPAPRIDRVGASHYCRGRRRKRATDAVFSGAAQWAASLGLVPYSLRISFSVVPGSGGFERRSSLSVLALLLLLVPRARTCVAGKSIRRGAGRHLHVTPQNSGVLSKADVGIIVR